MGMGFMSETFKQMTVLDAHLYLAMIYVQNGDTLRAIKELRSAREIIGYPRFTSRLTNDPKEIEKILSRFNTSEEEQ